jgi:hypothetical protein
MWLGYGLKRTADFLALSKQRRKAPLDLLDLCVDLVQFIT